MFYVYLIQSGKDESFYIGQTDNLEERLKRHNAGRVYATRSRLPWSLVGYEEYTTREAARWREYKLKRSYSEKKKFFQKFMSS